MVRDDGDVPLGIAAEGDREIMAPAALEHAIAAGAKLGELSPEARQIARIEDDGGGGAHPVPALAAEQAVDRQPRQAPRQVPQRHVDGADGEGDDPAIAGPVGRLAELRPDRLDIAGIAAHEPRREAPLHDHFHRDGGVFRPGDGLAPADGAAGRLQPDQRDMAGLAVVVRLRIAQRESFDPGDLLLAHRKSSSFPTGMVRPSFAARYIASTNSTVSTPSEAGEPLAPRPSTTSTRLSAGAQSG